MTAETDALIRAIEASEGLPAVTVAQYALRVREQLERQGYAIMRVEPWAGAPERLAIVGYPCTCPRGCMEHPFGPPREVDRLPGWPDPDARPTY